MRTVSQFLGTGGLSDVVERIGRYGMLALLGLLVLTERSAGQSATANYRFASPNELTIVVNVLGAVQKPGRYEISRTIDLPNLLSLAGGESENADFSRVRITRLVKTGERLVRRELRVNLDDLTRTVDAEMILHEGDFIYVPRSSGVTFQEVVSYVTTAALLTTAVLSIINQTK